MFFFLIFNYESLKYIKYKGVSLILLLYLLLTAITVTVSIVFKTLTFFFFHLGTYVIYSDNSFHLSTYVIYSDNIAVTFFQ